MKLYKFHWYCGRMGDVNGVFLAKPKDVADALGKRVYFGEILGKHSEIYGDLEADAVTALDVSDDFIKEFAKHFPDGFGHNPLKCLGEDDA